MTLPNCVRCKARLDCFTPFERGRCANCGLEYDELTTIANTLLTALQLYVHLDNYRRAGCQITAAGWAQCHQAATEAIAKARNEEDQA